MTNAIKDVLCIRVHKVVALSLLGTALETFRPTGGCMGDEIKTGPGGEFERPARGRLFLKDAATFVAVVCLALVSSGLVDIWFSYHEQRALLVRIQQSEAEFAVAKISQFVKAKEDLMDWATQLPWNTDTAAEWRFDATRLLRQLPAIAELTQLDAGGRDHFACRSKRTEWLQAGSIVLTSQHSKRLRLIRSITGQSTFWRALNPI